MAKGFRYALLLSVLIVTLGWGASAITGRRGPVTPEAIMQGDCAPCVFEDISFRKDGGLVGLVYVGLPIHSGADVEEVAGFLLPESPLKRQDPKVEQAVFRSDGKAFRASAGELARYNACIGREDDDACKTHGTLPLPIQTGGTVSLAFSFRRKSGMPGAVQNWNAIVPRGFLAPAFGASIRSDRELHSDGDLVPDAASGGLRYEDRGFGYLVASTASGWSEPAQNHRRVEDALLRAGAAALQRVPESGASRAEDALAIHWLWIRRNLAYRRSYNVLDGGFAPLAIEDLLGRGAGDCKDFTLLLRGLLAREGIESQAILVDTEVAADEPLTRLPTSRTDHVILYVPALARYVDPTLAHSTPIPTGGRKPYPFAVDTMSGKVLSIPAERTK